MCDTPHGLKSSSFSLVLFLPASYAGMRSKPHARGACHRPNYWATAQILLSDVDCSNAIPMPNEATLLVRTVEHPPLHLALAHMPTHRTGSAGIAFLLQGNVHSTSLCLIREQKASLAV